MAKRSRSICKLTRLSLGDIQKWKREGHGLMIVDFTQATTDALNAKSRGFNAQALNAMAGRWVLLRTSNDRCYPLAVQYNETERAHFGDMNTNDAPSFRLEAINASYNLIGINDRITRYEGVCLKCGLFVEHGSSHNCSRVVHTCENCGSVLTTKKEKKRGICSNCMASRCNHLYGYHSRPQRGRPLFEYIDKRAKKAHFGIEVELDYIRDASVRAPQLGAIINEDPFTPLAYFETDGSLNGGFEVITRPLTFDGYEKIEPTLDKLYNFAHEHHAKFGERNGMHIHIDNEYLNDCDGGLPKAQSFLEYMIHHFYDFWASISGRKDGAFGYAHKKSSATNLFGAIQNLYDTEHSLAVNLSNSSTTELRIFGGKIASKDDLLAVLDIAQALARFVKEATIAQISKATPASIIPAIKDTTRVLAYVKARRDDSERHRTHEGEHDLEQFIAKLEARG